MKLRKTWLVLCAAAMALSLLSGCGAAPGPSVPDKEPQYANGEKLPGDLVEIEPEEVPLAATTLTYTPKTGDTSYTGGGVTIDASNTAEGYVMVKYDGSNQKVKLQITKNGGTTYTYDIKARGSYEVFPFTEGNGTYTVNVFENISGTSYASALSKQVSVTLKNSTLPFLYPNQYVNFSANSEAVKKASELASGVSSEMDKVTAVYNYVVENISYDTQKASTVQSGYLPNIDSTLSSKKGICFDYASLMTAMLRSQNIPTKLDVGYVSGGLYHAWISTYISDVGWVNGVIYFDGQNWKLMDPTFASSAGSSDSIMQFIGDGTNYSVKYVY